MTRASQREAQPSRPGDGRREAAASRLHAAVEKLQSDRKIFGATEIARERIAQLSEGLGIGVSEADAASTSGCFT